MTTHLSLQRPLLPTAQVSALTTGSITLPSARGAFVLPTAYQSISSTVLSSTQQTISFTNIPQTFKHLEIRGYHWLNANGNNWDSSAYYKINNDANDSNYNVLGIGSLNTTAPSVSASTASRTLIPRTGGNENGTYYPAQSIIRIYDYSSTTKYKSALVQNGVENTGTGGYTFLRANTWLSNSAITQIDFTPAGSDVWASGTTFSLYGIMGE